MCDVCVAEEALAAGRCRTDQCVAYRKGAEITWHDSPPAIAKPKWRTPKMGRLEKLRLKWRRTVSAAKRKAIAKKMLNRVSHDDRNPTPSVCVRAMGKSAEYKPAKYQIRLSCLPWPKKWTKTKDLAGSMCHYGLDVRWDAVPKPVRDWVLGKRAKPPSERELIALLPKRASDESMKAEITFFDPKTKRFSASLKGGKGAFPVMFAGAKKKVGQLWANRTAVR